MGDMQRSIRFPEDLAAAVEREAAELDRSFSWVVLNAVRAELSRGRRSESVERYTPERARRETLTPDKRVSDLPSREAHTTPRPAIPGVVRASSLVKGGVRPIPKGKP